MRLCVRMLVAPEVIAGPGAKLLLAEAAAGVSDHEISKAFGKVKTTNIPGLHVLHMPLLIYSFAHSSFPLFSQRGRGPEQTDCFSRLPVPAPAEACRAISTCVAISVTLMS